LRTVGFPAAWAVEGLGLAIDRNSLARYSKRTHGSCVHDLPVASFLGDRMRLIVSWFQALFTSLPRYFSAFARATKFAIGLRTYLGSEVCSSRLPARYPTHGTRDTSNLASFVRLRDFHPLGSAVPGTFGSERQRVRRSTTPHLPTLAGQGFGLSYAVFDRLYSRHLV
jgi:hypothetical protein